jgi:hypothetical protein
VLDAGDRERHCPAYAERQQLAGVGEAGIVVRPRPSIRIARRTSTTSAGLGGPAYALLQCCH